MKISTSLLTCNFGELKKELQSIESTDYIHLDIMDGNFVPNISFGPFISNKISELTSVPLDIHLMVQDPLKWISKFKFHNTHFITIHAEANNFLDAFRKIKMLGIKAGICVKQNTPISQISKCLKDADLILVMTVEPGFGGQMFNEQGIERVKELDDLRKEHGYHYEIEVDGGINKNNIKRLKEAKTDICVCGSYIFNQKNRKKVIEDLKK